MEPYSVLMSVYQKETPDYFYIAIQSMLNQTIPPDDIVMMCDGPLTPELDQVIAYFDRKHPGLFQIVRIPQNGGLGKALREGVLRCKHEIIARMDTDDIAVPTRVEHQMKHMLHDKRIGAVGGQIGEFTTLPAPSITGYRMVPLTAQQVRKRAATHNPMNHMTVLLRKSAVLDAGNYMDFPLFEDYHLWSRMLAKEYDLINVDEICVFARVDNMHQRRGGMDYFKQTAEMERHLIRCGLIGKLQYRKNLAVRFLGTVVISGKLRGLAYNHFLRSSKPSQTDETLLRKLHTAYHREYTDEGSHT